MSTVKAGGSTDNNRDSAGRRLGLKKFGGEVVVPGNIILRQRGTQWHPGAGVGCGKDHTLFAKVSGRVMFSKNKHTKRRSVAVCTEDEWLAHLEKKRKLRESPPSNHFSWVGNDPRLAIPPELMADAESQGAPVLSLAKDSNTVHVTV